MHFSKKMTFLLLLYQSRGDSSFKKKSFLCGIFLKIYFWHPFFPFFQPGILAVLDDVCASQHGVREGADANLKSKLMQNCAGNRHFQDCAEGFAVHHYAGEYFMMLLLLLLLVLLLLIMKSQVPTREQQYLHKLPNYCHKKSKNCGFP